jgi:hypothetical protein
MTRKSVCVTVDTTVDVDVELTDFNDDDLIEELEDRGYKIFDEEDETSPFLNKYDCELILDRLGWDAKPGSEFGYVIEKIRSLYYGR